MTATRIPHVRVTRDGVAAPAPVTTAVATGNSGLDAAIAGSGVGVVDAQGGDFVTAVAIFQSDGVNPGAWLAIGSQPWDHAAAADGVDVVATFFPPDSGAELLLVERVIVDGVEISWFATAPHTVHDTLQAAYVASSDPASVWVAATSASDFSIPANDGNKVLVLVNSSGSAATVEVVPQHTYGGLILASQICECPAGATRYFGPWPPALFNDENGDVVIAAGSGSVSLYTWGI